MLVLDWIEKLGNLINATQGFAKQNTLATTTTEPFQTGQLRVRLVAAER